MFYCFIKSHPTYSHHYNLLRTLTKCRQLFTGDICWGVSDPELSCRWVCLWGRSLWFFLDDRGGDHPPVLPLSHQPVNKDFSWFWHSFPWKGFPSVETERTVGVSEWINHPRQANRTAWTLPKPEAVANTYASHMGLHQSTAAHSYPSALPLQPPAGGSSLGEGNLVKATLLPKGPIFQATCCNTVGVWAVVPSRKYMALR